MKSCRSPRPPDTRHVTAPGWAGEEQTAKAHHEEALGPSRGKTNPQGGRRSDGARAPTALTGGRSRKAGESRKGHIQPGGAAKGTGVNEHGPVTALL